MAPKVKKLYWLGKGLVKVDGKLYGKDSDNGRAFPTAKVDADRLEQWQKDGLASDKPFEEDDSNTGTEKLNAKIKELSGEIVRLNQAGVSGECEKCSDLEEELAEANEKIEKFEKELNDLNELISTPAGSGA